MKAQSHIENATDLPIIFRGDNRDLRWIQGQDLWHQQPPGPIYTPIWVRQWQRLPPRPLILSQITQHIH